MNTIITAVPFRSIFEDPKPNDPAPADPKPNDPAPADPKPNDSAPASFTQEQVDAMITKERESHTATVNELKTLRQTSTFSAEERQRLDAQIAKAENDMLTEKQRAQNELDRVANEHKTALNTQTERADMFETLYKDTTIQRTLSDAAVQHKAFNPSQVVSMLRPNTTMTEEIVEGKTTGKLIPLTAIQTVVEGKNVTVKVPPSEAVKLMSEDANSHNLFSPTLKAGGGRTNNGNGGPAHSLAQAAEMSQEAYMEARKNTKG